MGNPKLRCSFSIQKGFGSSLLLSSQQEGCGRISVEGTSANPRCIYEGIAAALPRQERALVLRTQEPLADVAGTLEKIPAGTKANLSKFCGDVLSEMRKRKAEPVPGPGAPEQSPQDLACNTPAKKLKADAQTCAPEEAAEPSEPLEYDLDNIDHCIAWVLAAFSSTRRESLQDVASFFVQNDLKPHVKKCFPLSAVFRDRVIDKGLLKTSQARTLWLNAWSQSRAKRFVPGPAQVWQKKTAVSSSKVKRSLAQLSELLDGVFCMAMCQQPQ